MDLNFPKCMVESYKFATVCRYTIMNINFLPLPWDIFAQPTNKEYGNICLVCWIHAKKFIWTFPICVNNINLYRALNSMINTIMMVLKQIFSADILLTIANQK